MDDDDRFYYSEQRYRRLHKRESDLSDKIYNKGENMNIYSNVEKENTSKKFMLIIISLLIIAAIFAVFRANYIANISQPMQSNGMSEVDRIKQIIREKELLKDQFAEAGREAAEEGNFDKSSEMAEKVGVLTGELEKLWNDLHEANIKEGVNGETK